MADKATARGSLSGMRDNYKPEHQIENRSMSRTSNYNETVRANNKRYDSGKPGKKLPRGKTAARQWRKSSR